MMRNLLTEEGTPIQVESASLPVATFALFQPQTSEFQEITDQRAMLEQALRNFACLTVGDMIGIRYNEKLYELLVMETRPANAVTVIECDLHVNHQINFNLLAIRKSFPFQTDFAPPADYVAPPQKGEDNTNDANSSLLAVTDSKPFVPFVGYGNR